MRLRNILVCVVTLCSAFLFAGCTSGDDSVSGTTSFYGKVKVNPSSVKQNEDIVLSIGASEISSGNVTVGIGGSSTINGKDVVKSVIYSIDGKNVAEGTGKDKGYAVTYNVGVLSVGEHTVTATCSSSFKNYKIEEHITVGELTVLP